MNCSFTILKKEILYNYQTQSLRYIVFLTCDGKTEPEELPICLLLLLVGVVTDLERGRVVRSGWETRHVDLCHSQVLVVLKDREAFRVPERHGAGHISEKKKKKV